MAMLNNQRVNLSIFRIVQTHPSFLTACTKVALLQRSYRLLRQKLDFPAESW